MVEALPDARASASLSFQAESSVADAGCVVAPSVVVVSVIVQANVIVDVMAITPSVIIFMWSPQGLEECPSPLSRDGANGHGWSAQVPSTFSCAGSCRSNTERSNNSFG
jgi:hypothetical protein